MAKTLISVSDLLTKYKGAGVYTIINDDSVVSNPGSGEQVRLVVGFSKIGWYNRPFYIEKGDYKTATMLYGERDRSLERKGSFFHKSLEVALSSGPVLALNLYPFSNTTELRNGVSVITGDTATMQSFSLNAKFLNGDPVKKLYTSFFAKDRFYVPKPDNVSYNKDKSNKDSLLSLVNLSQRPISYIIRSAPYNKKLDMTIKEWYSGREIPEYLNPNSNVNDYFIEIIVINGNYGVNEYDNINNNHDLGKHFTKDGLKSSDLESFLSKVSVVGRMTGAVIPEFVDGSGNSMSIDNLMNSNASNTGILCNIDRDLLESHHYEDGDIIDVKGYNVVGDYTSGMISHKFANKRSESDYKSYKSTTNDIVVNAKYEDGVLILSDNGNKINEHLSYVIRSFNDGDVLNPFVISDIKKDGINKIVSGSHKNGVGTISMTNHNYGSMRYATVKSEISGSTTVTIMPTGSVEYDGGSTHTNYHSSGNWHTYTNGGVVVTYYKNSDVSDNTTDGGVTINVDGESVIVSINDVSGISLGDNTVAKLLQSVDPETMTVTVGSDSATMAAMEGQVHTFDVSVVPVKKVVSRSKSILEYVTTISKKSVAVIGEVSVGDVIEFKGDVATVISKSKVDATNTDAVTRALSGRNIVDVSIITIDKDVTVDNTDNINVLDKISNSNLLEIFYQAPFSPRKEVFPDGTWAKAKAIYNVIHDTNIGKSLIDAEFSSFRYIIDTFNGGIESSSKSVLTKLARDRQRCLALINTPTIKEFKDSVDPRFTDAPSAEEPNPEVKISYIVNGGEGTNKYSLPDENEGASFAGYFFPSLVVRNDDGSTTEVPPSAYVSNAFMRKFGTTDEYKPVAGVIRGAISGDGLVGVSYPMIRDEYADLIEFGINPIITKGGQITIYGNETAYQRSTSMLNNIHARDTLITFEIDTEKLILPYIFDYNDDRLKGTIATLLRNYYDNMKNAYGAITDYKITINRSNNPEWVIANGGFIIDVEVDITNVAKKFINRITLSGQSVSQSGFSVV